MQAPEIVLWRTQRHLSQRELAARLVVNRRTLIRWEAGDTVPPADLEAQLAALGIAPHLPTTSQHALREPDILMDVCMPGVTPPSGFPKTDERYWRAHVVRAYAAHFVEGLGMVDDKPDGFGPVCSCWFDLRGIPPAFIQGNVRVIREMQEQGLPLAGVLALVDAMPKWRSIPD